MIQLLKIRSFIWSTISTFILAGCIRTHDIWQNILKVSYYPTTLERAACFEIMIHNRFSHPNGKSQNFQTFLCAGSILYLHYVERIKSIPFPRKKYFSLYRTHTHTHTNRQIAIVGLILIVIYSLAGPYCMFFFSFILSCWVISISILYII